MSKWMLNLWPTNRNAKNGIDLQLDYQWAMQGNPLSVLPPVIEVGLDGDVFEVYFSFSYLGRNELGLETSSVELTLETRSEVGQLEPEHQTGLRLPAGCSWRVPLTAPPVAETQEIISFTVTATAFLETGGILRYSVDPEMVIQATGKPEPARR